jgi:tetratricopeptide (TPR) repeat protein
VLQRLPLAQELPFLAAGRGLAAAHAAGLVHRDFKPQNVMVGADGDVRVMDFGLARSVDADPEFEPGPSPPPPANAADVPPVPLTRTGELVGTPLYMAPEQFLGQRTDARADQFSFCEALYQALYGAHPFGGASLGDLTAAVIGGRVRPPPAKTSVPPWLRRVLLRGLSVDPAERWPSMDALTSALARDPARRRKHWLGGVSAALAVAAAGWAIRLPARAESVCRGGPRRLAEAWELDGGPGADHPRRDATRTAFIKSGHTGAADLWERAARALDGYSAGWLNMYRDACEATHVRGEQSAEVLDLRMTCLTDRLERIRALTDAFAEANPTLVDNAVSAAAALPSLDRCADVPLLRAVVPPPDNPQARARTEALKRDLARVKALSDSGQCARAAVAARALTSEAQKIGHLALQAEGLVEVAQWGSECMQAEDLIAVCREAVVSAIAAHDTEVAAEAAVILAQTQAERTPDVARARDWIDLGTALTQALTKPHPILESWRLNALGRVLEKEGDGERGLEALRQAKELVEKTQGPEHPNNAKLLTGIGASLEAHGRFSEALAAYRRAEEVAVKTLGPVHVMVGLAVADEAGALNALHRYEEARATCERALEIWRRAAASSFYEGWTLMMLGESLVGLGRPADAVAPLERAKSLLKDDPSTFLYEVRFALARALAASPSERSRGVALAREALTGYRRLDHNAAQISEIDDWLRAQGPEGSRDRLR